MENRINKRFIIVATLILLTIAFVVPAGKVRSVDDIGIKLALPDAFSSYTGENIMFCQNHSCLMQFSAGNLAESNNCPSCNSRLDDKAYGENLMFPQNTELLRKRYTDTNGDVFIATIVLSHADRASIHRPHLCLKGQGYSITQQKISRISVSDETEIKATSLILNRHINKSSASSGPVATFSYWFTSQSSETPSYLVHTLLSIRNRLFRGVAEKWAYITVLAPIENCDNQPGPRTTRFITDLYRELQTGEMRLQ